MFIIIIFLMQQFKMANQSKMYQYVMGECTDEFGTVTIDVWPRAWCYRVEVNGVLVWKVYWPTHCSKAQINKLILRNGAPDKLTWAICDFELLAQFSKLRLFDCI
jgi:hypothetical protein